jgi:vitamin B12 transporter
MTRTVVVLCGWMAAAPSIAAAQSNPSPQPPTFSLTVVGTEDVVTHVGATERVNREDIDALHARTLDEALGFTPGVRVRGGGSGRPLVDLRGLRSRQVLLLLDGVPLNSTSDGQFDPALMPTEFLRAVHVSFGASSILYGDGAMAGVIELESDTPPQGFALEGTADVRQGAQALGTVRTSLGGTRATLLVTGSGFNSEGFRVSSGLAPTSTENGGRRANSDADRQTVFGRFTYAPSDRWRLATVVSASNGSYGVPPSLVDDPADVFAQRVRYERVEALRARTAQFSWAFAPRTRFSARGWVFLNREEQERARYDNASYNSIADETINGTFQSTDQTSVSGVAAHARYDTGRAGRLTVAVNGRYERFETAGVIRDVEIGGTGSGGGGRGGTGPGTTTRRFAQRAFDEDHHLETYSAGVEWSGRPAVGLGLVAGLSESWQERPSLMSASGTSAMAGLFRDIGSSATVRASVFHRIRFPSIRYLHEAGSGSPDLTPERSQGVDAGVTRRWARVGQLGLDAFWTYTRDFIERTDDGLRYVNRDRYRLRGFELSASPDVGTRHSVRFAYTFLDAVDRSLEGQRDELQYQPRHRVTLDGRWALPVGRIAADPIRPVASRGSSCSSRYRRGTAPASP